MKDSKYTPKKTFHVVDQEELEDYIDSIDDPAMFYEGWGQRGIPTYIILRENIKTYDDADALNEEDPAVPSDIEEYTVYDTFDVHKNGDVSTHCSWHEFRLDYLVEDGLLEEVGYYPYLPELEELEEDSVWSFDILREDIEHPREL